MTKTILITCITYATGIVGFLSGMALSTGIERLGRKFYGVSMAFIAGLLIAFVCFGMLPVAFSSSGVEIGIAGMLAGVLAAVLLERKVEKTHGGAHYVKVGLIIGLSLALHKIPEGVAVGSMFSYDMSAGMSMAVIVALHCIPESVAMTLSLKAGGASCARLTAACFLVCIPMAFGGFWGVALYQVSSIFITLCLSFAGGVMIYIACGEMIPESRDTVKASLSMIAAAAGFLLGVVLTAKL